MKTNNSSTKGKKRVTFRLSDRNASKVFIAGSFNDWSEKKRELKKVDGEFTTTMMLPRGRHEYKFVVDGKWYADPNCPECFDNEYGSQNSIIEV